MSSPAEIPAVQLSISARVAARLAGALGVLLGPLERALAGRAWPEGPPPVFILGAPRSGTTLLYQILVHGYETTYLDNLCSQLPDLPILAKWLSRTLLGPDPERSDFRSEWGRTNGLKGPSECAAMWYRWFPGAEQPYVAPGSTPERSLRELRGTCTALAAMAHRPLVVKNTVNCMRIAGIAEALPEALFLVVERDLAGTAASLLAGRIRRRGSAEGWVGTVPREIEALRGRPAWEQVVDQTFFLRRQIQRDRERLGADRFHTVRYEGLCADPRTEMSRVLGFLARHGLTLAPREELPEAFPAPSSAKLDRELLERVEHRAQALETGTATVQP